MRLTFDAAQRVGRALMLPIAVLPLAGLLLRLGQPDLLDLKFIAAAGDALFANLGLLFAAGIGVGLAKDNNGAAGLAGIVCYLVLTEGAKTLFTAPPDIAAAATEAWIDGSIAKLSVPAGIGSGLTAGALYNRFHAIRVPEYLAFFGGRRFVPLAAGGAGLIGALGLGLGLPALEHGIDLLSNWTLRSGSFGLFIYGVANRLLLVTGLHHVLNNMVWFVVGDFHGATGDLKRFFAGDPSAGGFMAGYFPVMMFGLPAACLAMYRNALPQQRAQVGGLFASLALTSLLTGVTEPIEFTFLFLAPLLYAFHAVMTGLAMVIMNALGVKLGFTFSAGLADYVINFGLATRPLLLLPVGAAYFAIYFAVFDWAIKRFNLLTPGRDATEDETPGTESGAAGDKTAGLVEALGGAGNLIGVDACTTRLRLTLADVGLIDEAALKRLGSRGVLRPGGGALQVVLGPTADTVAGEIRAWLRHGAAQTIKTEQAKPHLQDPPQLPTVIAAIGEEHILDHRIQGNRLLLTLGNGDMKPELTKVAGVRAVVQTGPGQWQVVLAPWQAAAGGLG